MKRLFVIIFLAIALIFSSCTPYGWIGDDIVQMSQYGDMHFVHVTMNDKPVLLLLDTGASKSILDISQSERYGFGYNLLSPDRYFGIGGATDMYAVYGYELNEMFIPFMGTDMSIVCQHFREQVINVVGIIGADFLERYKVIINFDDNTIHFKKKR